MRKLVLLLLAVASLTARAAEPALPPDVGAMMQHISADSMRGHLSFLSSELLAGRGAGTPGVDLAAEYIAAQFRRIGLKPANGESYFQESRWTCAEHDSSRPWITLTAGGRTATVPNAAIDLFFRQGWQAEGAPVIMSVEQALADASAADGKILLVALPHGASPEAVYQFAHIKARPAAIVLLTDGVRTGVGYPTLKRWLVDPEAPAASTPKQHIVLAYGEALATLQGQQPTSVRIDVPAPTVHPTTVRNVAAILPGSDAALKDSYVMLSAHYDHLGTQDGQIYPGANDDGSGAVSLIEIADAMAKLKPHPRRSLLFLAVFGEENGLLGSRYYGRHPLVPIAATVADINLEQMGRTDDSEGAQVNSLMLTGFDYSDVGAVLHKAGALTGIRLVNRAPESDAYFARSDNQALADQGVPAHTLSVSYEFPGYHGTADTWDKVDYANMARVDRMVALSAYMLAQDAVRPMWNKANPRTGKYLEAFRKLQLAGAAAPAHH